MEQVFYLPTKKGFRKVCYFSFDVLVQELEGRDNQGIDNYLGSLFLEYDWVLVEDSKGELHLARHPVDVYNLRDVWEGVERLKREREEERKRIEEI